MTGLPGWGDVTSTGGNPEVTATRSEIERVAQTLDAVRHLVYAQLELGDLFTHPAVTARFAIEAPALLLRISNITHACSVAAEQYFSTEAKIHHVLSHFAPFPVQWLAIAGMVLTDPLQLLAPSDPTAKKVLGTSLAIGPTHMGGLVDRLRSVEFDHPGTLRIEEYGKTGSRTFVAYLPGTENWLPIKGINPINVNADIAALAGPNLAMTERAAVKALENAGVGVDDKVIFVGFSQGGLVAANIASRPQNFDIGGIVALGAPMNTVKLPTDVPVYSVEHLNDMVPLLDNAMNPLSDNIVTVNRMAPMYLGDSIFEPHHLSAYITTTKLADESSDMGITRISDQILTDISGEPARVSWFQVGEKESMMHKLAEFAIDRFAKS
jgi:hypothetical protein